MQGSGLEVLYGVVPSSQDLQSGGDFLVCLDARHACHEVSKQTTTPACLKQFGMCLVIVSNSSSYTTLKVTTSGLNLRDLAGVLQLELQSTHTVT